MAQGGVRGGGTAGAWKTEKCRSMGHLPLQTLRAGLSPQETLGVGSGRTVRTVNWGSRRLAKGKCSDISPPSVSSPALPFLPGPPWAAQFLCWGLPPWPDRSSHPGMAPLCRFLLGPSWAWGPSSGAYTCRRTSCRPCPPCPASASWSWWTSAAIPSAVTASCFHCTGEHPHVDP